MVADMVGWRKEEVTNSGGLISPFLAPWKKRIFTLR